MDRLALIACGAAAFAFASAGCVSSMRSANVYTGRHPRSDAVLLQASRELACPLGGLRIVAETSRRAINETALRFVVEGCGVRGSYVEECDLIAGAPEPGWTIVEDTIACRDFLVAKLPLQP